MYCAVHVFTLCYCSPADINICRRGQSVTDCLFSMEVDMNMKVTFSMIIYDRLYFKNDLSAHLWTLLSLFVCLFFLFLEEPRAAISLV